MAKKQTNESKLTYELKRAIVRQLHHRKNIRTWDKIAKTHGISRRNLSGHVRALRTS